MDYLVLNLVFTAIAVLLYLSIRPGFNLKALGFAASALVLMTVVGDNFIVGTGIVDYDANKILGIRIGVAPVEDFFYAIIAILLVPAIWAATGSLSTDRKVVEDAAAKNAETEETK